MNERRWHRAEGWPKVHFYGPPTRSGPRADGRVAGYRHPCLGTIWEANVGAKSTYYSTCADAKAHVEAQLDTTEKPT